MELNMKQHINSTQNTEHKPKTKTKKFKPKTHA